MSRLVVKIGFQDWSSILIFKIFLKIVFKIVVKIGCQDRLSTLVFKIGCQDWFSRLVVRTFVKTGVICCASSVSISDIFYQARARARRACAMRALGLLLADGTPTVGGGEDFLTGQPDFFTETAVTPERKVEKSFPRWENNRHAKG